MKKTATLLALAAMLLASVPGHSSAAAKAPKLYLDGTELKSAGPRIEKDTTYIPIRTVAEGMGFDVDWDKSSKKVGIHNGMSAIELTIDKKTALVNGQEAALPVPARIMGTPASASTMVPLRFVSENMGLTVYYDAPAKSVYLYQSYAAEKGEQAPADSQNGTPQGGAASGPGSSQPGGSGSSGQAGGGSGSTATAAGSVTSILYDGIGTTTIAYQGTVAAAEPFLMTGPDRIVLDMPASSFADSFGIQAGSSQSGELTVDGPLLNKIRYAYLTDQPTTVRVVWDVAPAVTYTLLKSEGLIQLSLLGAGETVPSAPATPSGDRIYKVVIDAGHGGSAPGAISLSGKLEKTFNLTVALKLNALLAAEPRIQPIMTRTDDATIDLKPRAEFANRLGADLFLSIHANSLEVPNTATGTETYYYRPDSKALADIVHKHLIAATGLPDRKVKTAAYVVIKESAMPAVLTESGFLTNLRDEAVLFDEQSQNRIAQALADGIKEYLGLY
ncbi:N-acetylmuramoyl-L-alanine amidase [Paenibacillus sp. P22]|uniref:N-acetylmuramoyl-L-alanine amidase n=1 Tax=Paenibacillus sp. P22 TaxID=483908 RepID=UPI0004361AE3|nr:N-acetylmuramoyl-L-alanine amidase [Paenibacillus sp. P22]CDN45652.1 Cell wall hydrolase/autolysin [Paenibacillus sp. P22]